MLTTMSSKSKYALATNMFAMDGKIDARQALKLEICTSYCLQNIHRYLACFYRP